MKKILSLVLCLSMVLTMMLGTTAFAAVDKSSTSSIAVTKIEDGATVQAYKIVDVQFNNGRFCGYCFDSSVKAWMLANDTYKYLVDTVDENATFNNLGKATSEVQTQFYNDLAAAIRANKLAPAITPITGTKVAGEALNITVRMGEYLLLVTGGKDIYNAKVVNVFPELVKKTDGTYEYTLPQSFDGALKSAPMTIEKKVDGESEVTKGLGDIVTYTISATVPQYNGNVTNRLFEITDAMAAGLTFNENSLKIEGLVGDTSTLLTEDEHYRFDKDTFTINFKYDRMKAYNKVLVTYKATVNKAAVIAGKGNENTAKVRYANDPHNKDAFDEKESKTKLYTFGLNIAKFDGDSNIPLEGAIFTLEKVDGTTKTSITRDGGFISDETGNIKINQLKDGKYILTETQAPGGYNKIAPIEFTISVNKEGNGKYTTDNTGNITVSTSDNVTFNGNTLYIDMPVKNLKTLLPSTGGQGTLIFTIVGVSLMLGVIGFVVVRKRMISSAR